MNQFITTRDTRVENIVNSESMGVGIRVIAGGAYGFASTNQMSEDAVAATANKRSQSPKRTQKLQSEPLVLAPVKALGEVAWATPFTKDWRKIAVKEKADMLIAANKAGLEAGARLHAIQPVPSESGKIFRFDRRFLHRSRYSSFVGTDDGHCR